MKGLQATLLAIGISVAGLSSVSAQDTSSRIINGTEAAEGSWPFIAALVMKGADPYQGQFCGASFIGERYILTAAHCTEGMEAEDIDVVIGSSDLSASNVESSRFAVKHIYTHESYVSASSGHDIAVIELSESATKVSVPLADQYLRNDLPTGESLTVMGWGNQNNQSDQFVSSSKLHQVNVPLVAQNVCRAATHPAYRSIGDDAFCAGFPQGGYDSCQGDSGGPIVVNNGGVTEQLGIVSWGIGCADEDAYGVYTNLSYFTNWITSATGGLSYNQQTDLGVKAPGSNSHTFDYTNNTDVAIKISNIAETSGLAVQSSNCSNLLVGETCQVTVDFNVTKLDFDSINIELSTDHPLYSKVKSRASFIGATAANQSASSLVDITNSGVFNTAPWESRDGYIVSPQIGNSEKTALIIEGIPRGELTIQIGVSSESYSDVMKLYVNGTQVDQMSGESVESKVAFLSQKLNTVMVAYEKDASLSRGTDDVRLLDFQLRESSDSSQGGDNVARSSSSGGTFGLYGLFMIFGFTALRSIRSRTTK
ncbi:serine protease [Vibrio sp. 99-70-13A1]|uniref:S1 family peptidase n=1 Tax=Vibrio sp. 99-70-13A1 TaxID=2607601 RepID=UPI001493A6E7|nr:serine protease [Vibrio sp. 99-70-13A1]NOH97914.1 serine protease [Vibrio sp. 99-70-13A1]